jgi:hypothetical protein
LTALQGFCKLLQIDGSALYRSISDKFRRAERVGIAGALASRSAGAALAAATMMCVGVTQAATLACGACLQRAPRDEVIRFVLPDRFANGDAANDRGGLVEVAPTLWAWRSARGSCVAAATGPGSYRVEIGPLDYKICVSEVGQ